VAVVTRGDFAKSMATLHEQAKGRWQASCEVDQVYAHYQEVHPEFRHPRGGQAFYLRDSIYLGNHMRTVAGLLFTEDGVDPGGALSRVAEDIAKSVIQRAPREFHDLRMSGHPKVTRDGGTVYDRAPFVRRLDPSQIRGKARLRYLLDPHRRTE
jgi:hypothetical protein